MLRRRLAALVVGAVGFALVAGCGSSGGAGLTLGFSQVGAESAALPNRQY